MLNDIRHAVRILLHAKGWTLIVVLSLALGIGANAALFRAVNGILIRTIPVADPDSLVRFRWVGQNDMVTASSDYGFVRPPRGVAAASTNTGFTQGAQRGTSVRATFSYPIFEQFKADNRTLADLVAGAPLGRANIVVDGSADLGPSFIASGNFEVVGIVSDARYNSLRESAPPTMHVPYGQARMTQATFEVRSALPPAGIVNAIRESVRQMDPSLPVTDVSTQAAQIEQRFVQEKSFARPTRGSAGWRCSWRQSGCSA